MNYDEALSLHLVSAWMGAPYEIPRATASYVQSQKLLQTYKDSIASLFILQQEGKKTLIGSAWASTELV